MPDAAPHVPFSISRADLRALVDAALELERWKAAGPLAIGPVCFVDGVVRLHELADAAQKWKQAHPESWAFRRAEFERTRERCADFARNLILERRAEWDVAFADQLSEAIRALEFEP